MKAVHPSSQADGGVCRLTEKESASQRHDVTARQRTTEERITNIHIHYLFPPVFLILGTHTYAQTLLNNSQHI